MRVGGKAFALKSTLHDHMLTHTGQHTVTGVLGIQLIGQRPIFRVAEPTVLALVGHSDPRPRFLEEALLPSRRGATACQNNSLTLISGRYPT